jgi:CDP-diacylglycerol--glycerol-3-phosphate 3-phosphatidyltransferase
MNLPNSITLARIAMAPIFVWLLLLNQSESVWQRWIVVGIFVLAIATDGIDGAIARKRGQVTELGKLLDPIADKVLIGGALVTLSALGQIHWWITIVIMFREIGITAFRLAVIKDRVIPASGGGKLKTVLQSIVVGLYLSPLGGAFEIVDIFQTVLLYVVLVLTVVSGVQYLLAARK